jgi:hypothetical protein
MGASAIPDLYIDRTSRLRDPKRLFQSSDFWQKLVPLAQGYEYE